MFHGFAPMIKGKRLALDSLAGLGKSIRYYLW
jgi:hypothetical protein